MKSILFVLTALNFHFSQASYKAIRDGLWVQECLLGLIKQQNINALHIELRENFYQDRNCQDVSFVFRTEGSLSYEDFNTTQINFIYSEIELSLWINEVVSDFNERQVCGLDDWKLGVFQKITGLQCALFNTHKSSPIPAVGDMKYGIFKIEDGQLYYGKLSKEFDGSAAAKRPIEFDLNYFKHLEIR